MVTQLTTRARLWVLGVMASLVAVSAASAAETYKVDAVHSSVIFGIKHMNVSNFYGRLNGISGTFAVDKADLPGSIIDITIDPESVDTNDKKRDAHIKSPDFFNSKQFPKITFKGSKFEVLGDNQYKVTGVLELHGVSQSITVTVEQVGAGPDGHGGYRSGIESRFKIKRSDFGMGGMLDALGDEVTIIVGLEGIRQ